MAAADEINDIVSVIKEAAKPVVIVGGGVRYSEAGEAVERFCEEFNIPFCETQGGKSACRSSHPYCLGGVGVTGTYASNVISREADVVIAVGTRLSIFTTSSKFLYQKEGVRIVTVNNNRYHAYKMDAVKAVGDARVIIKQCATRLKDCGYQSKYTDEIRKARKWWDQELEWLGKIQYTGEGFEPIISKRDLRTLPEFVRLTGGDYVHTDRSNCGNTGNNRGGCNDYNGRRFIAKLLAAHVEDG